MSIDSKKMWRKEASERDTQWRESTIMGRCGKRKAADGEMESTKATIVDRRDTLKKSCESSAVAVAASLDEMEDMIEEVLVRLPIKSLTRCKILSKKWHHYITCNPSFCQTYLSRHYAGESCVMLGFFFSIARHHHKIKDQVRFLPTTIEGKKRKRGGCGLPSPLDESLNFLGHQSTHVVGSSNGFLLLTLELLHPVHYFICNPMTKQWRALPLPKTISKCVTHGFVCHPTMSSSGRYGYQIVRCMWENFRTFSNNLTIEVFTSEINEWKLLNLSAPFSFFLDQTTISAVVTEQGVIYMSAVVKKPTDGTSIVSIIFFDQTKQEQSLQLVELPRPSNVGYYTCSYLGQSNGLVLYAYYALGLRQLKVWVLNHKEWSLKYQISLEKSAEKCPEFVIQDHQYFDIEAFHPFNPQLIFLNIGHKCVLLDFEKSSLELVSDLCAQGWGRRYFLFPFTSSLIRNNVFVH